MGKLLSEVRVVRRGGFMDLSSELQINWIGGFIEVRF
jgi:hypothetical protein